MDTNRELEALLQLVDDPDREVFETVQKRLLFHGLPVIPRLEMLWENAICSDVQERIEMIIHRIHFEDLQREFRVWLQDDTSLLHGALLVCKYQYPELQTMQALQELERMRRNLWLEMNNFITPIEQIKIIESILYNYYKMQGGEVNYAQPDDFLLHKVIERKKGNALGISLLYLILAEQLDLPIKYIGIPRQFVLAYFSQEALFDQGVAKADPASFIQFFIDPNSGIGFSHKDVMQYFNRTGIKPVASYYRPHTPMQIIQVLLTELAQCFDHPDTQYKKEELMQLHDLLG